MHTYIMQNKNNKTGFKELKILIIFKFLLLFVDKM